MMYVMLDESRDQTLADLGTLSSLRVAMATC
jgi:hypothetical protein